MTKPHGQPLQMSEAEILAIAHEREFFVAKYGNSHERLRKKCRRMKKDGLLVLVSRNSRGFNYRSPEAVELDKAIDDFTLTPDAVEP